MTQNCPIWNTVESKDWKDKTAIAKINRSNMVYTARAVYPSNNTGPSTETFEEGETLDQGSNSPVTYSRGPIILSVRSKSMDKLIHILAVASEKEIDDIELASNLSDMSDSAKHQHLATTVAASPSEFGHLTLMKSRVARFVLINIMFH